MTYADAVALIKTWALAGTGLSLALMENEPRPWTDPAWVLLSVASGPEAIGVDQTSYEEPDPFVGVLDEVVRGVRAMTMTIAVESQSQDPAESGVAYLARLQARAWVPTVRAALGDVAMVRLGPIRTADYQDPNDDRWISRAEMDVSVTYGIEERPAVGDETPAIASAVVSTEYGGAVPTALEMDEEIPPP